MFLKSVAFQKPPGVPLPEFPRASGPGSRIMNGKLRSAAAVSAIWAGIIPLTKNHPFGV